MAGWFGKKPEEATPEVQEKSHQAHMIVLGNEKGGSGKTTTAMHIITSLMRLGFNVGSIDIDARQRSLSRYLENRRKTIEETGTSLPMPAHIIITKSPFNIVEEAEEDERERFEQARDRLKQCDFIIIDSPGNDTYLSRLAHSWANTVITPINDSFVDLDVLATVSGKDLQIIRPSVYSEMVWEQKLVKARRDKGSLEWIVMRNRLSNIDARNKRFMKQVTEELSRRIGFRLAPGFSERVIFREMFLQGLTVLDVIATGKSNSVSMSHIAARQEVRDLLKTLRIPEIDRRISEMKQKESAQNQEEAPAPASKAEPAPAPQKEAATASEPIKTPAAQPATSASPAATTNAGSTVEPVVTPPQPATVPVNPAPAATPAVAAPPPRYATSSPLVNDTPAVDYRKTPVSAGS